MIEYGKSRKVVLPDLLKREIQGTKLQRELRRRGIGQHTIEKALDAHIRVNTYRKIVSAIEEYKLEKVHDPGKESLCHTKTRNVDASGNETIGTNARKSMSRHSPEPLGIDAPLPDPNSAQVSLTNTHVAIGAKPRTCYCLCPRRDLISSHCRYSWSASTFCKASSVLLR